MSSLFTTTKCRITIGGEELKINDAQALTSLRVSQAVSLPTQCELAFSDLDNECIKKYESSGGESIVIEIEGSEHYLFKGTITAVEIYFGPAQQRILRIRAYDELYTLRKRQHIKSHVQVTLKDLFYEATAGSSITVDEPNTGPLWNWVMQYQQSDLDFLTRIAQRSGRYFYLNNSTLHFFSLTGLSRTVELERGTTLLEATVTVNNDPAVKDVEVLGWNQSRITDHAGKVTKPIAAQSVVTDFQHNNNWEINNFSLPGVTVESDEHAEALAQSMFDRRVASERSISGHAEGTTAIQPGIRLSIKGLGNSIDRTYIPTKVLHTIDPQKGYITSFSSLPPQQPVYREQNVTTLGIVCSVDDPLQCGRIKASLPSFNRIETDWMSVVLPGAGDKKGLIALPDVGDRVYISLTDGEPVNGVVLGGLLGTESEPPELGVEADGIKRYRFATPGGQQVFMDDSAGQIRIENSDGSYCDLSPKKCTLHAEGDWVIEAPGKKITITGEKIDFRKG